MNKSLLSSLTVLLVIGCIAPVSAQDNLPPLTAEQPQTNVQPVSTSTVEAVAPSNDQMGLKKFDAESFPSVLFTYWEQVAIEDARRSRGMNRTPTEAELARDLKKDPNEAMPPPDPESRNIALSGIAYEGSKNWTIWLNGERVTPKAIPKEALDLKVFKEYIEIKWFDEYTNRIIPIRLRPHQRFNIDARIFLPG